MGRSYTEKVWLSGLPNRYSKQQHYTRQEPRTYNLMQLLTVLGELLSQNCAAVAPTCWQCSAPCTREKVSAPRLGQLVAQNNVVSALKTWRRCAIRGGTTALPNYYPFGRNATKRPKTQQSAGKAMATVFWDVHGIIHIDNLEKGKSITIQY